MAVTLGFVASRVAFHAAGVRFDVSGLAWLWQFLDPAWLRHDLAQSLLYLHSQPPLMNALLGVVLKVAGSHAPAVFHVLYESLGLALALALLGVLRGLGLGNRAAAAIALVYAICPTAVLYEHWLMYTHLEAVGLVIAAWALHRFAAERRTRHVVICFAVLASLALLRSLFHPLWLLPCGALALAVAAPPRRVAALCFAIALALTLGLSAKNAWLLGTPGTSSWLGMNFANGLLQLWPLEERRALVEQGVITELSLVDPFSPLEAVPPAFQTSAPVDVPALAAPAKANEVTNFNHFAYIAISRQYGRDATALLRRDPRRWLVMEGRAWRRFLAAPSNYPLVEGNRRRMRGWDRLYGLLQGIPSAVRGPLTSADHPDRTPGAERLSWLWLAVGLFGIAYATRSLLRGARAAARVPLAARNRARMALLAFLLGNVLYVSLTANAVELGENQRFRVTIEPLWLALAAAAIHGVYRARKGAAGAAR